MGVIVLTATTTAVLRLYNGHPYQFHILTALLTLVTVECLLMLLAALVRGRR
jgi:hypothetical protein